MLSYIESKTEGLRREGSVESVSRKSSLVENHRPRTMRFQVLLVGFGEDHIIWPHRPRLHCIQGSVSGFGVDDDFWAAVYKGVLWA